MCTASLSSFKFNPVKFQCVASVEGEDSQRFAGVRSLPLLHRLAGGKGFENRHLL